MARPFTRGVVHTYLSWELRDRDEGAVAETVSYVSEGPDPGSRTYWGRSDTHKWVLVRRAKHPNHTWEGIYQ